MSRPKKKGFLPAPPSSEPPTLSFPSIYSSSRLSPRRLPRGRPRSSTPFHNTTQHNTPYLLRFEEFLVGGELGFHPWSDLVLFMEISKGWELRLLGDCFWGISFHWVKIKKKQIGGRNWTWMKKKTMVKNNTRRKEIQWKKEMMKKENERWNFLKKKLTQSRHWCVTPYPSICPVGNLSLTVNASHSIVKSALHRIVWRK